MDIQNKYDEVLVKYILNEANDTEIKFVDEWLGADGNNMEHFKTLTKTLRLLSAKENISNIDVEEEWQHLQYLFNNRQLLKKESDAVDTAVVEMFPENNSRTRYKIFKLLAAAAAVAAVLIVVLWGYGIFSGNTTADEKIAGNAVYPDSTKIDTRTGIMVHEVNTTGKVRMIRLPDGSEVKLFDNSEFTYQEQYPKVKRELFLTGKADFKVVKDKARPFMVYSGDIYTTDIGTEFRVTAMPNEHQISVRLFEGKVVVNSSKSRHGKMLRDVFLDPGQELIYDVNSGSARIRLFTEDVAKGTPADNPAIPNSKRSWFMFNNQRLSSIFNDLSKMYDVKIAYSKEDIGKIYFIGTFDKNDSIGFILKQIAAVNNLTVTNESNVYTIKK